MSEKKVIQRSNNWVSNFMLIGKPKINNFTFKIDQTSNKSNWIYSAMNLGIDCGERSGCVYCDLMGGYSADGENKIFAHGKKDDVSDDFKTPITVDWNDRFNEDILEKIGKKSLIEVVLEKTDKGNVFKKKFLSEYDAIAYIKEHLSDDMVVVVRGDLKYSEYNGNVQVKKNITSISLAIDKNAKDFYTSDKFKATFTQSVLIDKDSASLKNVDKDRGVMYVDTIVLDYLKEKDGIEIKGQYPYRKQFEYVLPDANNDSQNKTIYEKLFKVKKDITQINFYGEFIESGAVVETTWDDVPDEIKELVSANIFTKEQALKACATNGNRESRMALKTPVIKLVGDDDKKVPTVQKFEDRYKESDLILDYLYQNGNKEDEPPFDTDEENCSDDSMDWLNSL